MSAHRITITCRGCLLGRAACLAATAHRTAVAALFHSSAGAPPCVCLTEAGARCADGRPRSSLLDLPRLAAFALLVGAFPAGAQEGCRATDVIDALLESFGETIHDVGLTREGLLVQWWGNIDTGTWTVVVVHASGQSCITLFGRAFEQTRPAPVGVPG